jgi:transposase
MSTSLLYHGFGLRAKGYVYQSTTYRDGAIVIRVERDSATLRCACCGSAEVIRSGAATRRLRGVPIGRKPVWIQTTVPRLSCRACGKTRRAAIGFAQARVSYTRAFERYALDLSRRMTIEAAAVHLGVSWDVIKDIQKRHLQHRFRKIRLRKVERIAIDEISIGKGQRYLTVVLDLDRGAVVFLGDGKGADALDPFWKKLRASRAKIQAVATDMSPAYTLAVHDHLPDAVHVFDRFHVVKLFNEKLSDLRRQLQHQAETIEHKKAIKGTRWLLLKNPENLDPNRNERQRLDEALRLNQPLAAAYYLKEDLRQFWEQADRTAAAAFLDDWIARASASGVGILQKFARTLQLHRTGLLNWYLHHISTGPLEGTNNKIRTMQRQAYGYRDQEFLRLKIFALHETNYALVG